MVYLSPAFMEEMSGMKNYSEIDVKAGDADFHLQGLLLLISCIASFCEGKLLNVYIYEISNED